MQRLADAAEILEHLGRGLIAIRRRLRHQLQHEAVQLRMDVGPMQRDARGLVLDVLQRHRERCFGLERRHARQHVVKRHPQRVQVAPMVQRVALRLFGTHIGRRAHRDPGLRQVDPIRVQIAAEPEVGHLDLTFAGQQQILGFDVAMDQPEFTRRADGHTGLSHNGKRQRIIEPALFLDVIAQVRALHVFHRDEANAFGRPQRINMDDVRMVQFRDGRGLGFEPAQIRRLRQEIGAKDFEGDGAVQADLAGQVNLAHATTAEQAFHLEIAEGHAGEVARRPG